MKLYIRKKDLVVLSIIFRHRGLYKHDTYTHMCDYIYHGFNDIDISLSIFSGHVYLTTTVYKHPAVTRRSTGDFPIMQGPMFIHSNADEETYHQFFSHLDLKMKDINKIIIGSDDEKALVNAIETAFGNKVVTIRCTRHLRINLERHLKDKVGMSENMRKKLSSDVFGTNGLIEASDPTDFEERKEVFLSNFIYNKKAREYIEKRILPILEQHVLQPVWQEGVPRLWTNNNSESQNNVLKHNSDWKLLKIPELIKMLHTITVTQYNQLVKSITQTGDFILTAAYRNYYIAPQQWEVKSSQQKEAIKRKFIKSRRPQRPGTLTSTDGKLTIPVKTSAGKKPGEYRKRSSFHI